MELLVAKRTVRPAACSAATSSAAPAIGSPPRYTTPSRSKMTSCGKGIRSAPTSRSYEESLPANLLEAGIDGEVSCARFGRHHARAGCAFGVARLGPAEESPSG